MFTRFLPKISIKQASVVSISKMNSSNLPFAKRKETSHMQFIYRTRLTIFKYLYSPVQYSLDSLRCHSGLVWNEVLNYENFRTILFCLFITILTMWAWGICGHVWYITKSKLVIAKYKSVYIVSFFNCGKRKRAKAQSYTIKMKRFGIPD